MLNDIKPTDRLLVKFADEIKISAPVKNANDTALIEVTNIKNKANENRLMIKCFGLCVSDKHVQNIGNSAE